MDKGGSEKIHLVTRVLLFCDPGGMEEDIHPLVTIPEAGLKILDSPDSFDHLRTTLEYFKTLIRYVVEE